MVKFCRPGVGPHIQPHLARDLVKDAAVEPTLWVVRCQRLLVIERKWPFGWI